jgi:hypothetical protein
MGLRESKQTESQTRFIHDSTTRGTFWWLQCCNKFLRTKACCELVEKISSRNDLSQSCPVRGSEHVHVRCRTSKRLPGLLSKAIVVHSAKIVDKETAILVTDSKHMRSHKLLQLVDWLRIMAPSTVKPAEFSTHTSFRASPNSGSRHAVVNNGRGLVIIDGRSSIYITYGNTIWSWSESYAFFSGC